MQTSVTPLKAMVLKEDQGCTTLSANRLEDMLPFRNLTG